MPTTLLYHDATSVGKDVPLFFQMCLKKQPCDGSGDAASCRPARLQKSISAAPTSRGGDCHSPAFAMRFVR